MNGGLSIPHSIHLLNNFFMILKQIEFLICGLIICINPPARWVQFPDVEPPWNSHISFSLAPLISIASNLSCQELWKNLLPKLNNKICQNDMPIPLQWTIWYQFLEITHPGMLTTLCLWNNYKTMWHLTPQESFRKITSIHDKESGPSMILSDNNDSHVSLLLLQSKNILVKDDGQRFCILSCNLRIGLYTVTCSGLF